MRTKVLFAAMVIVAVVMVFASPAFAGQVTRIAYGLENVTTYEYTPTQTGPLDISVSWTDSNGVASVFPVSEVDAVVQMYDSASKENYMDPDVASLYAGTNPEVGSVSITTQLVNKPVYISVLPWIGDCQFHIVVTFRGTTVIDQTGTAYGHGGEFYMPATADGGTWLSVMQTWPGTLDRVGGTSDVYANWDDYAWEVDPSGAGTLANAWQVDANSYIPPLRTETPIDGRAGVADKWYVVAPEIWTSAARPNVWTKIATDSFPKPGTLAYNAAPLWYTYSWTDSALADAPGYFGGVVANVGASGHSFTSLTNSSSSLAFTFTGTSFKWIYSKGSAGGIAKVTIDGGTPILVDQYNAGAQFKQSTTFGGLANTAHSVVIASNKTKNAASSNFVLYHDAFEATGFSGDASLLAENNSDGSTIYSWAKVNNAAAHGGNFSQESNTSAATAFTFTGTSIDYIYTKGPNGGKARVYIDGVNKGTVDLYAASVAFQQSTTFGGLPAGMHTILIANDKTKNAASGNYVLYLDAFNVGGTFYEN